MEEGYSKCPYNGQHILRTIRMPAHMLKCRKNYKGPPLQQCRYNATHLLPAEELQKHEQEQCLDCYKFHSTDFEKIAEKFKHRQVE